MAANDYTLLAGVELNEGVRDSRKQPSWDRLGVMGSHADRDLAAEASPPCEPEIRGIQSPAVGGDEGRGTLLCFLSGLGQFDPNQHIFNLISCCLSS